MLNKILNGELRRMDEQPHQYEALIKYYQIYLRKYRLEQQFFSCDSKTHQFWLLKRFYEEHGVEERHFLCLKQLFMVNRYEDYYVNISIAKQLYKALEERLSRTQDLLEIEKLNMEKLIVSKKMLRTVYKKLKSNLKKAEK